MSRRRAHDEQGSLTVELVVVTPVVLLMVLVTVVFGRVAEARQQVVGAARAGAEVASVQPDGPVALVEAANAAAEGLSGHARTCAEETVTTDTSHFHGGGYVTVTVSCRVPLADLGFPGLPGSTTVHASSTAPIDPYRSVG